MRKTLQPSELERKVCVVVGTRPGIIMFSPIIRELERQGVPFFVLHTGQHYSYNMDRTFFRGLGLAAPAYQLGTGQRCKLHGEQTADMLRGCEQVLLDERPKIVLVGGDANTNLAAALAARKLGIQMGHVEAGERSHDWRMPEEHNRRMIDHISDHLFATNQDSQHHLVKENVQGTITVTGNPIVDAVRQNLDLAFTKGRAQRYLGSLHADEYALMTLHREENVDDPDLLARIIEGVKEVGRQHQLPVVFPVHPRTLGRLAHDAIFMAPIVMARPADYLTFLQLLHGAEFVLTDSGGVQQEAYILNRKCVTLRENTEWRCTLHDNCNVLAGTTPEGILAAAKTPTPQVWGSPFGGGSPSTAIVDLVKGVLYD